MVAPPAARGFPLDPNLWNIQPESDGRLCVEVQQRIADLTGNVLVDRIVYHVYRLEDGLIASMEIRESAGAE